MNRRTLIPLIVASLLLVLSLGGYVVTFSLVSNLQEESFLLADEIKAAQDKEARISRAERTLAAIMEQEEMVSSYFVTENSVVDFLEELEGIEERTDVAITIGSVGGEGETFDISLTVEGQFRNVMQTLEAIESLPVFISVTRASIDTVVRESNDEGIWTASAGYSIVKK